MDSLCKRCEYSYIIKKYCFFPSNWFRDIDDRTECIWFKPDPLPYIDTTKSICQRCGKSVDKKDIVHCGKAKFLCKECLGK